MLRTAKISLTSVLLTAFSFMAAAADAPPAGTIVDGSLKGKTMTFSSAGGMFQEGQVAALKEFIDRTGVNLSSDLSEMAKLRAQVESKNVIWDVVGTADLQPAAYCGKLFQKLDYSKIDKSKIPGGQGGECGVPSMNYATLYLYKTAKYGANPPKNWNDFFDVKKYPGVRAIYSGSMSPHYLIELALLADGVPKDKLFPADLDRAINKMRAMRSSGHLIFWKTGAQSQTMLETGEADMVVAWSGRALTATKNGAKFTPVWDGWVVSSDQLSIPIGAKDYNASAALINAYLGANAQTIMSEKTSYSPVHIDSKPKVDPFVAQWLTNTPERQAQGYVPNAAYWVANYQRLNEKWSEFLVGN